MDWFIDSTGTWCKYVDPDATITDYFKFDAGLDASCNNIDVSSFTTSVSGGALSIIDSSQSGNIIVIQAKGCGYLKITLSMNNGDIRPIIRCYKESNRSLAF